MRTSDNCLFCAIVAGAEPSWIIWENETHIAFLTPFPNTPGFTVLATKEHFDSDIFKLGAHELHEFIDAAQTVSGILNKALATQRTALIAEGMGIDHAHMKLVPLHGIAAGPWRAINSTKREFFNEYQGFISSHDGPRAAEQELEAIAAKIKAVLAG